MSISGSEFKAAPIVNMGYKFFTADKQTQFLQMSKDQQLERFQEAILKCTKQRDENWEIVHFCAQNKLFPLRDKFEKDPSRYDNFQKFTEGAIRFATKSYSIEALRIFAEIDEKAFADNKWLIIDALHFNINAWPIFCRKYFPVEAIKFLIQHCQEDLTGFWQEFLWRRGTTKIYDPEATKELFSFICLQTFISLDMTHVTPADKAFNEEEAEIFNKGVAFRAKAKNHFSKRVQSKESGTEMVDIMVGRIAKGLHPVFQSADNRELVGKTLSGKPGLEARQEPEGSAYSP